MALCWRDAVDKLADLAPGCLVRALFGFSHEVLELGEELLDGIEVGAIRRQEEQVSALISDRLARRLAFMRAEIVEDDDVSGLEGRREKLLDIGGEEFAVDRPVDNAGSIDPVMPQSRDEGEGLPVAIRNLGGETLAFWSPAAQRRHVGLHPGLVDEDQPAGGDPALVGLPALALPGDVRPVLLRRQSGFF